MWNLDLKKAEHQRIGACELWCWKRILRVPWTARRSKSILKEISPEYSLEGWCWSWNSSTLATWCEELTHWKRPWCWERLRAGGEVEDRRWDGWMASPTQWSWVWLNSGGWWWTGRPGMLLSMGSQRVGHDWVAELNWTINCFSKFFALMKFPLTFVLPEEIWVVQWKEGWEPFSSPGPIIMDHEFHFKWRATMRFDCQPLDFSLNILPLLSYPLITYFSNFL